MRMRGGRPWSCALVYVFSVVAVESGVLRGHTVQCGGCESVGFCAAPQQKLRAVCTPLQRNDQKAE